MKKMMETVIDIAIDREIAAGDFYRDLAGKVEDRAVRDTLTFLAGEEQNHRDFLMGYRDGRYGSDALCLTDTVDYKIAEYLGEPDTSGEMKSADVYLVATHREFQLYLFYRALADLHPDGEIREMLLRIAGEEMRHKEKVGYLCSNVAFP